ncbi:Integrator complex subunit 9-like protein [Drosera capensis]
MKLTCLSEGGNYHFPPCHILNICGFRVLLDCPLDLSSLMIFSPVPPSSNTRPQNVVSECGCDLSLDSISVGGKKKKLRPDDEISVNSLVHSVPWYKTVDNLHLWDVSFFDVVLISRPEGMLGLPFLTRCKGFSAQIYATDVTRRLGQLMIEDLVAMHKEFRQFYGPEGSDLPDWMKMDQLEKFPLQLKEIVLGKDGTRFGGWMPLYSAADVKDCIQKVESLKYAEEVCYNGVLLIKAFSSGCGIGACNWRLKGPKRDASYLCSSVCAYGPAMNFDWKGLQDSDTIIYSDFSSIDGGENVGTEVDHSAQMLATNGLSGSNTDQSSIEKLVDSDKSSEAGKLEFLLSCIVDSIRASGSVLIPMGQLTVMLELLDQIKLSQELSLLKVPIFIISSVATEVLSFLSIIPEWLCRQKQEKKGIDAELALLPFKPVTMKVLQCSFLSTVSLSKILPRLEALRPKLVLFPNSLKQAITSPYPSCLSSLSYSENITLSVPNSRVCSELEISADLVFRYLWRKLRQENASVAALEGKLIMDHGRQRLVLEDEPTNPFPKKPALRWGSLEPDALLSALQKMGIHGTIEKEADENVDVFSVHVTEPGKVLLKVRGTDAVISTADKGLAARVLDAVDSILDKL